MQLPFQTKIIAIGGGEISHPQNDNTGSSASETLFIDKEIFHLTNKPGAKLLFIPTASQDSKKYFERVKIYFTALGFASVDVLYVLDDTLTSKEIEDKILSHDAIYVGGGNTQKMLAIWRKLGIDRMLRHALNRGVVLSGLSAGSICWFQGGFSRASITTNIDSRTEFVSALDFIDALNFPHYDNNKDFQVVKRETKGSTKITICLSDRAALEVIGSKYRVLRSGPNARAYKAYWKRDKFYCHELPVRDSFDSLEKLLQKRGI